MSELDDLEKKVQHAIYKIVMRWGTINPPEPLMLKQMEEATNKIIEEFEKTHCVVCAIQNHLDEKI